MSNRHRLSRPVVGHPPVPLPSYHPSTLLTEADALALLNITPDLLPRLVASGAILAVDAEGSAGGDRRYVGATVRRVAAALRDPRQRAELLDA